MEYKNISLKLMLQTQTKYENTEIQTCLCEFFFSVIIQKTHTAQVSYCQNSDIREVSVDLLQSS